MKQEMFGCPDLNVSCPVNNNLLVLIVIENGFLCRVLRTQGHNRANLAWWARSAHDESVE